MSCSRLGLVLFAPAAALLLLLAPPAPAQCFGPDNLDVGPCCGPAAPNLPVFPGGSAPALGACWDRCTQGLQRTLKVTWTTPGPSACSEWSSQLDVFDGVSGLPLLTGKMVMHYTRTWTEIDPGGTPTQVWRFVVKADLGVVPGLVVNCPVPACLPPAGPHPTAFYYGYMDYAACNPSAGFENVLVLVHAPDRFIHAPGLSDRPGVFHPGQSYAIIAPHSALQPFVPGNAIAPGGPLVAEAVRNVNVLGIPPGVCMVEDAVAQGTLVKLGAGCLAAIMNNPKQYTLRQFSGQTTCVGAAGLPGAWTSLNLSFPTLPWFHMVTASVGTWSNPNVYPGKETCWVDEGLFVHQDACTGDVFEIKYGGSTSGGWTALLSGLVVGHFTDIADNYSAPLSGPFPVPVLGSIRPTEHLIYVNEP